MKKIIQMTSVIAGILFILYLISWVLSGGASENQTQKYKQQIQKEQQKIRKGVN
jgi:hypothetical protein